MQIRVKELKDCQSRIALCDRCQTLYSGPSHVHYCWECFHALKRAKRRWQLHLSTLTLLGFLCGAMLLANFSGQLTKHDTVVPDIVFMDMRGQRNPPHRSYDKTVSWGWPLACKSRTEAINQAWVQYDIDSWKTRDAKDEIYFDDNPVDPSLRSPDEKRIAKWHYTKYIENWDSRELLIIDVIVALSILVISALMLECAANYSDAVRLWQKRTSNLTAPIASAHPMAR